MFAHSPRLSRWNHSPPLLFSAKRHRWLIDGERERSVFLSSFWSRCVQPSQCTSLLSSTTPMCDRICVRQADEWCGCTLWNWRPSYRQQQAVIECRRKGREKDSVISNGKPAILTRKWNTYTHRMAESVSSQSATRSECFFRLGGVGLFSVWWCWWCPRLPGTLSGLCIWWVRKWERVSEKSRAIWKIDTAAVAATAAAARYKHTHKHTRLRMVQLAKSGSQRKGK